MVTDPLDAAGLLALADGAAPWQTMPAAARMGHVHLHVSQIDQALAFYCDVLGFDLIQRYGPSAAFVSAGGYHHHIGLNTWAGVGAPPAPAGSAGLRYATVVLPDEVALLAAVERVRGAGIAVAPQDGGWHLHDPAGNGIRARIEAAPHEKRCHLIRRDGIFCARYSAFNASNAAWKQPGGAATRPAPTMPTPGSLWAMPVLRRGVMPVSHHPAHVDAHRCAAEVQRRDAEGAVLTDRDLVHGQGWC
jgi:catechol 2,3-dioxygenase-like lactoylglutathione lyase family enzyme